MGDNYDVFPNDASEHIDSDGDGIGDNSDAFPFDSSESEDQDSDGVGDYSDVFPNDASEHIDSDGDGIGDNSDAFPFDSSESEDQDGDGVGDNSDMFPFHPNEHTDSDGDGVGDNSDAYPLDASKSVASSMLPIYLLLIISLVALVSLFIFRKMNPSHNISLDGTDFVSEEILQQESSPQQGVEYREDITERTIESVTVLPDITLTGVIGDDGYEWLEFPEGSGKHFYRIPGAESWQKWDN